MTSPIRMTGLNSGLDTESIVKALTSNYQNKVDKNKKAQTKLAWKQDAWKEINKKVYSLYSSLDSLRYSSGYKLKKAVSSDTTKATVSASGSAFNGTQTLKILKTASSATMTGAKLDKGTTESTTLAELGLTSNDGKITLTLGSGENQKTKELKVTASTTVGQFVNQLQDAGLSANFDSKNGRIFINSKESGSKGDFSLTGANTSGANALYALGLSVKTESGSKLYEGYAGDGNETTESKLANAIATYKTNKTAVADNEASISNIRAAYAYANALTSRDQAYEDSNIENLTAADRSRYETALLASSDAIMTADNTVYNKVSTDDDGNITYSYTDADGNEKRILAKATGEDAQGNKTYTYYDQEKQGEEYVTSSTARGDLTTVSDVKKSLEDRYVFAAGTSDEDKEKALNNFRSAVSSAAATIRDFGSASETITSDTAETYTRAELKDAIDSAYGTSGSALTSLTDGFAEKIQTNRANVKAAQEFINKNGALASIAELEEGSTAYNEAFAALVEKVNNASALSTNQPVNDGVSFTKGDDAIIDLNGVTYTSETGSFSINGLNITALAKTDDEGITINTQTDTQGLYDKIKDFISNYNDVINELTDVYNAASAKGYEPLTDDEKSAMSDKQVEKWEKKIKDSLLRRDTTLNSIMQTMTTSMASVYEVNGKKYSLASFGIKTKGILNSEANRQNAFHIDGDADDSDVSANTDKLMAAINEDPDSVTEFMKQLVDGLYKNLDKKMKSTNMRSAYTIYNDKEMKTEYSSYTSQIKKWQDRLSAMEEKYYKQFAKMESTLSKLQSSTSGITGLMGR